MAGIGPTELIILVVICTLSLIALTILGVISLVLRLSRQGNSQRVKCPYILRRIDPARGESLPLLRP
jgi:hypothetical protein